MTANHKPKLVFQLLIIITIPKAYLNDYKISIGNRMYLRAIKE